jgi:hypothetical protein
MPMRVAETLAHAPPKEDSDHMGGQDAGSYQAQATGHDNVP